MPNTISPFASSFELIAHCLAGEHGTSLELMRRMWGYMLDGKGMTNSTFLEGYTLNGNISKCLSSYRHRFMLIFGSEYPAYWSSARNSHAHGWSSGPTFVLSTQILGIQLLRPMGYSWRIEPHFVDLDSVEGGYATQLGKFVVKWKKGGKLHVETPEGTSGHVVWDGKTRRLQGGGAWIWDDDGWRPTAKSETPSHIKFHEPNPEQEKLALERLQAQGAAGWEFPAQNDQVPLVTYV